MNDQSMECIEVIIAIPTRLKYYSSTNINKRGKRRNQRSAVIQKCSKCQHPIASLKNKKRQSFLAIHIVYI